MNQYEIIAKVIIIGDASVGKSTYWEDLVTTLPKNWGFVNISAEKKEGKIAEKEDWKKEGKTTIAGIYALLIPEDRQKIAYVLVPSGQKDYKVNFKIAIGHFINSETKLLPVIIADAVRSLTGDTAYEDFFATVEKRANEVNAEILPPIHYITKIDIEGANPEETANKLRKRYESRRKRYNWPEEMEIYAVNLKEIKDESDKERKMELAKGGSLYALLSRIERYSLIK